MHNGAEQMEMSLSASRDYVSSKQRKCQLVMNKQRHRGETTDLDFDLGSDASLLKITTRTKMKKNASWVIIMPGLWD